MLLKLFTNSYFMCFHSHHSGPEMLVAFHSSPFSAPLQQGIPNRGFELDVDILFTDSDSYDFAQGTKNLCEFHINASNPGKQWMKDTSNYRGSDKEGGAIVELSSKANANINECGTHRQTHKYTHTQVHKNMKVGQHNALLSVSHSLSPSLTPSLSLLLPLSLSCSCNLHTSSCRLLSPFSALRSALIQLHCLIYKLLLFILPAH